MQNGTLKAVAHSMRKSGFYPAIAVDEANAMEGRPLLRTDTNPKLFENRKAIGHDAFAACFVNGGMSAIDDGNGEAGPPGCNGSGKSSRPASANEYFGFANRFLHGPYQRSSTNSEQKPGPIAARML